MKKDKYLKEAELKYGETHTVEKVFGTSPDLRNLKNGQEVMWGDGETYHILLTKKSNT